MMSEESFFSMKMAKMSDAELKNYIQNKDDYQDYAVLTAVLELEKRGVSVENAEILKEKLAEKPTVENEVITAPIEVISSSSTITPALYSTQSIFIFGALFSVFGGSILMVLNLFQLNKKNSGWYVIIGAVIYSFALSYIYTFLNITDKVAITNMASFEDLFTALLISLVSNVLGVYLLYHFIWKKEMPTESNYQKRSITKPILIILAINFLAAIILMSSGNFPQL